MPKLLTLYLNYNITSDKNQKLLHCKCKIHALFVCESTTLDIWKKSLWFLNIMDKFKCLHDFHVEVLM